MSKQIKLIYGTHRTADDANAEEALNMLQRYGVVDLDTASLYPGSERRLGELRAPERFYIHTKAPGFYDGALSRSSMAAAAENSFSCLGVDQVETYFLHSPDAATPLEETLSFVHELYKAGKFKHFGLSNFKPDQVREVYDLALSKDYVLPTVFQGNYNPVARHYEAVLFPLLRELKIAFYAYSPIAGGFLTKSPEMFEEGGYAGDRWDKTTFSGQLYDRLYNKASFRRGLGEWERIAAAAGVSKAALAYRFIAYHSALSPDLGDGMIVGASTPNQLKQTLDAVGEGPLESAIVDRVEKVWETVKQDAPLDNFHS